MVVNAPTVPTKIVCTRGLELPATIPDPYDVVHKSTLGANSGTNKANAQLSEKHAKTKATSSASEARNPTPNGIAANEPPKKVIETKKPLMSHATVESPPGAVRLLATVESPPQAMPASASVEMPAWLLDHLARLQQVVAHVTTEAVGGGGIRKRWGRRARGRKGDRV